VLSLKVSGASSAREQVKFVFEEKGETFFLQAGFMTITRRGFC